MEQVDAEYISWLCSPDYMIPKARKYGLEQVQLTEPDLLEQALENPDFLAVIGAARAAKDVRKSLRSYVKYICHRDNISTVDIKLAQKMRRAGWLGSYQRVDPLPNSTAWRQDTTKIWPVGGVITARLSIKVPKAGYKVDVAIVKALSEMLVKYPKMNRAFLQGRAWQRYDGHVMLNLEPAREQVRAMLIDAHDMSLEKVSKTLTKGVRNLVAAEKEYKKEVAVFDSIFKKWCETGFIASPAGVMVSLVGTKFLPAIGAEGQSALLTGVNGVGIGVVATYTEPTRCVLWAGFDHRLYDADHEATYLKHMQKRLPELLEEE